MSEELKFQDIEALAPENPLPETRRLFSTLFPQLCSLPFLMRQFDRRNVMRIRLSRMVYVTMIGDRSALRHIAPQNCR